jgi:nicotinate-nucleotide adenylyltransferase
MTRKRRLGVLGGTFDPIHNGHLRAGEAARQTLDLDEVRVFPSHDPPHRPHTPRASAFHRFALAALAIQGRAGWRLSDAELTRPGPSYTAHTLRGLHKEGWDPAQIFFIIGADAFAEIATWFEFPAVLRYANFAVVARPGVVTPKTLLQRLDIARFTEPASPNSPGLFTIEAEMPDISSTDIRARLAAGHPIDDLVPTPLGHYIQNHGLYGSSATEVRLKADTPSAAVDDLHGETERFHR